MAGTVLGAAAGGGYKIVRLGRGPHNRICLAATIEGTEGLIILDTGASATVLGEGKYKFLLSGGDRKLPAGMPKTISVNGLTSPTTVARSYRLGSLDLGAVPCCIVPSRYFYDYQELYAQGSERQYDGLMGENLLRHYNAIVDCSRLLLYLNTDPAHKIDPGPALVRAGWTRVPMSDLGNDFTVPCTLGGHRFRLAVDTGAPYTDLDTDQLRKTEIQAVDTQMTSSLIGQHDVSTGFLKVDSIRIGDYTAGTSQAFVRTGLSAAMTDRRHASVTDAPILGLLGGNFLSHNSAIIDVGNHGLYLKPENTTGGPVQH